jgi:hypothetical protein
MSLKVLKFLKYFRLVFEQINPCELTIIIKEINIIIIVSKGGGLVPRHLKKQAPTEPWTHYQSVKKVIDDSYPTDRHHKHEPWRLYWTQKATRECEAHDQLS